MNLPHRTDQSRDLTRFGNLWASPNSAYGNVLRDQRRMFDGRDSGSQLSNPDFQTYAKAFGVRSWRVTDAAALRTAVTEALAANAPALIEVMTDITKEYAPWEFIAPVRG